MSHASSAAHEPRPGGPRLPARFAFAAFLAVAGAGALLYVASGRIECDRSAVTSLVDRLQTWGRVPGAPLVLVLVHWIGSLACLPGIALVFVMISSVGVPLGALIALAGTCLSSLTVLAVSRLLGRPYIASTFPLALARTERLLTARTTLRVIQLRLLPFIPFHIVNAACGIAGVDPGRFALGTVVGVLPKLCVHLCFARTLLAALDSPGRLFWINAGVSLVLFVVVTLIGIRIERRIGDSTEARGQAP